MTCLSLLGIRSENSIRQSLFDRGGFTRSYNRQYIQCCCLDQLAEIATTDQECGATMVANENCKYFLSHFTAIILFTWTLM